MELKEVLIPVVRAEKDGTVYCPHLPQGLGGQGRAGNSPLLRKSYGNFGLTALSLWFIM